jgi:hypothetical protein
VTIQTPFKNDEKAPAPTRDRRSVTVGDDRARRFASLHGNSLYVARHDEAMAVVTIPDELAARTISIVALDDYARLLEVAV